MGSGSRRSLLPVLLLLLPGTRGDCGPLPNISHAEPPEAVKHQESFREGYRVTYSCIKGYSKLPLSSDTIQCLPNSQWSHLPEFCGRTCPSPPRVHFAKISPEDETQNFYAVNVTVRYFCRQGYENTTDQPLTTTCLDNLEWSEVPELCRKKSCGVPADPEHGRVIASDHLFGTKANVVCNHGYTLKGASAAVWCFLKRGEVTWGPIPACHAVSCPPPPAIPDGKHDSNGTEEFTYGSVVTYTCDPGLQLLGNETLRCTTENSVDGVWSGSPPECRVPTSAATNQTTPSEETAENPYWLAGIIILCCTVPPVALGILTGIIVRWKDSKKHSCNMHLQKHERKGRDPPTPPKTTADGKPPLLWNSYFCHTTSCHVCPTCVERLHSALAPGHHGCAPCEAWLSTQPSPPHTFSASSISDGESPSPAGMRSPAKAADVLRSEGTGGAVLEQSKAEQPMDHGSSHHMCPTCESWIRAHLGQCDSRAAAPGEHNQGPRGPVCPPCTDQLHLSLVHSDTSSCPVCPLAREGSLAHLIPHRTPSCHLCPVCSVPTHTHLCQAPDG